MATPAAGGGPPALVVDAGPPPNLLPVKTPPNSGTAPASPPAAKSSNTLLARFSSAASAAQPPSTPTFPSRPPPSRAARAKLALLAFPWLPVFGWLASVAGLLVYVGAAVAAATPGRRLAVLLGSEGGGAPRLVAGAAVPVALVVAAAVATAVVGAAASAARADAAARADGRFGGSAAAAGTGGGGKAKSWLRRWPPLSRLLSLGRRASCSSSSSSAPPPPPAASPSAAPATPLSASNAVAAATGSNNGLAKPSLQLQHSLSHPRPAPSVFAASGGLGGGACFYSNNAQTQTPPQVVALPPRRRAYRAQRLACALMALACGAFAAASVGLALAYGAGKEREKNVFIVFIFQEFSLHRKKEKTQRFSHQKSHQKKPRPSAAITYSDMASAAHRASDGTAASLAVASDVLDGADAIGSMMRDPANIDNPALVALNSTISSLYESVSPGLRAAMQAGAAAVAARIEDDGRPPKVDAPAKDEAVMIWSSPTPDSPIVRATQQATQLEAMDAGSNATAAAAAAAAASVLAPQGVRVCQSSLCADMTAVPGARSRTCVCRPATLRTLRRLAEPGAKRAATAAGGLILLSFGCVALLAAYASAATAADYELDAAHGRGTRVDRLVEAKAARRARQQAAGLGRGSSLSWLPLSGGSPLARWTSTATTTNPSASANAAAAVAAAAAAAAAAVASPRSLPSSSPRAWGGGKLTIPAALVWESSGGGGSRAAAGAARGTTAAAASSSSSSSCHPPLPGIPGQQPGSQLRPLGRASWDGVASLKKGGSGSGSRSSSGRGAGGLPAASSSTSSAAAAAAAAVAAPAAAPSAAPPPPPCITAPYHFPPPRRPSAGGGNSMRQVSWRTDSGSGASSIPARGGGGGDGGASAAGGENNGRASGVGSDSAV